jgi:hypothetical protein
LLVASACSKAPAPVPSEPLITPLATQDVPPAAAPIEETIHSNVVANGVGASYRASFLADQLHQITETRAGSQAGAYEFRGARLLGYTGAALSRPGAGELRFNMQGVVTMSKADAGTVPAEEISAIRTRAQLLRSHALAQRASRSHQPQH